MHKFYFTYGPCGFPFAGGWTEIEADNKYQACQIFRAVHPDKPRGNLNCSTIYTEEQFVAAGLSDTDCHFGKYCQERIRLQREVIPENKQNKERGIVITTNGEMHVKYFAKPLYKSINQTVGGLIEHVLPKGLKSPYCMLVNEAGLLKNLPLNLVGCMLYQTVQHGNVVVGNIVIMKDDIVNGEPDIVGLNDDDITKVIQNIAQVAIAWEMGIE